MFEVAYLQTGSVTLIMYINDFNNSLLCQKQLYPDKLKGLERPMEGRTFSFDIELQLTEHSTVYSGTA